MDPHTSAQDVMRCDLCETAVVQMHCDTCLVNLCTACVGKHMISDESEDHKVVKFQSRKSIPLYPGSITKHGEDWHREVDKIVRKLKDEVDEMKNTQLQTLQKHLDEINKKISDIKDEIDSVEMAIDTNDLSKLFSITSNVDIYRNLPHKIMLSLPRFMPGKIQGEELSKLFGTLSSSSSTSNEYGYSMKTTQTSLEAGSFSPVKQLLDEPEIVTTINTGYAYLFNVNQN
ncbi:uncharacterized protein LOC133178242 [Saccostrea echinata]|uniref:uncharacterized protein LOC133178242 n=1 Tax=Saccostrea echinata TaxID=191078 RepID=UPI002A7F1958|nr:uncharacterized protein LOC133178242 [Saccostrea echinata]